jgi:hypothetical protein
MNVVDILLQAVKKPNELKKKNFSAQLKFNNKKNYTSFFSKKVMSLA